MDLTPNLMTLNEISQSIPGGIVAAPASAFGKRAALSILWRIDSVNSYWDNAEIQRVAVDHLGLAYDHSSLRSCDDSKGYHRRKNGSTILYALFSFRNHLVFVPQIRTHASGIGAIPY